jgi:hypothetical protein
MKRYRGSGGPTPAVPRKRNSGTGFVAWRLSKSNSRTKSAWASDTVTLNTVNQPVHPLGPLALELGYPGINLFLHWDRHVPKFLYALVISELKIRRKARTVEPRGVTPPWTGEIPVPEKLDAMLTLTVNNEGNFLDCGSRRTRSPPHATCSSHEN